MACIISFPVLVATPTGYGGITPGPYTLSLVRTSHQDVQGTNSQATPQLAFTSKGALRLALRPDATSSLQKDEKDSRTLLIQHTVTKSSSRWLGWRGKQGQVGAAGAHQTLLLQFASDVELSLFRLSWACIQQGQQLPLHLSTTIKEGSLSKHTITGFAPRHAVLMPGCLLLFDSAKATYPRQLLPLDLTQYAPRYDSQKSLFHLTGAWRERVVLRCPGAQGDSLEWWHALCQACEIRHDDYSGQLLNPVPSDQPPQPRPAPSQASTPCTPRTPSPGSPHADHVGPSGREGINGSLVALPLLAHHVPDHVEPSSQTSTEVPLVPLPSLSPSPHTPGTGARYSTCGSPVVSTLSSSLAGHHSAPTSPNTMTGERKTLGVFALRPHGLCDAGDVVCGTLDTRVRAGGVLGGRGSGRGVVGTASQGGCDAGCGPDAARITRLGSDPAAAVSRRLLQPACSPAGSCTASPRPTATHATAPPPTTLPAKPCMDNAMHGTQYDPCAPTSTPDIQPQQCWRQTEGVPTRRSTLSRGSDSSASFHEYTMQSSPHAGMQTTPVSCGTKPTSSGVDNVVTASTRPMHGCGTSPVASSSGEGRVGQVDRGNSEAHSGEDSGTSDDRVTELSQLRQLCAALRTVREQLSATNREYMQQQQELGPQAPQQPTSSDAQSLHYGSTGLDSPAKVPSGLTAGGGMRAVDVVCMSDDNDPPSDQHCAPPWQGFNSSTPHTNTNANISSTSTGKPAHPHSHQGATDISTNTTTSTSQPPCPHMDQGTQKDTGSRNAEAAHACAAKPVAHESSFSVATVCDTAARGLSARTTQETQPVLTSHFTLAQHMGALPVQVAQGHTAQSQPQLQSHLLASTDSQPPQPQPHLQLDSMGPRATSTMLDGQPCSYTTKDEGIFKPHGVPVAVSPRFTRQRLCAAVRSPHRALPLSWHSGYDVMCYDNPLYTSATTSSQSSSSHSCDDGGMSHPCDGVCAVGVVASSTPSTQATHIHTPVTHGPTLSPQATCKGQFNEAMGGVGTHVGVGVGLVASGLELAQDSGARRVQALTRIRAAAQAAQQQLARALSRYKISMRLVHGSVPPTPTVPSSTPGDPPQATRAAHVPLTPLGGSFAGPAVHLPSTAPPTMHTAPCDHSHTASRQVEEPVSPVSQQQGGMVPQPCLSRSMLHHTRCLQALLHELNNGVLSPRGFVRELSGAGTA